MARKISKQTAEAPKSKASEIKLRQVKDYAATVKEIMSGFDDTSKLNFLKELGVGEDYFTCDICSNPKHRKDFYISTDPNSKSKVTHICRECAGKFATPTVNGKKTTPTKETINNALYYLDKPYLDSVFEGSMLEASNMVSGKLRNNIWSYYIKNIQMPNYYTKTYRDSDGYKNGLVSTYTPQTQETSEVNIQTEIYEQFEKNKKDVLRLLGYLPFEKENIEDQPFLYSQLIGFLDASEEGNDDMMRTSSIISIIRGFLQESQIDDMIAKLTSDLENAERNISTCKALQAMKANIAQSVTKLAESSCISLKHSKNAKKGENTWTGKIKKIQDMNLREGEINGFDIGTCKGMRQVMDMSNASILRQLRLDESEWSDMVATMRKTITDLRQEKDNYQEIARILLRENLDLKDVMLDNNIPISDNLTDLKELFATFAITREDETEEEEVDNDE